VFHSPLRDNTVAEGTDTIIIYSPMTARNFDNWDDVMADLNQKQRPVPPQPDRKAKPRHSRHYY
jgi:hypothetical protein